MKMSLFFSIIFRWIYFVSLPTLRYLAASTCNLRAVRLEKYDGKKILQSEINILTNVTRINCCAACSREKYCLSFHFYPDGPTCATLRERFSNVSVTSTRVPGYQLFQTDKPLATVGSDCELDVDCKSLSNSHCHSGSCTCDVGHRSDGNTCRNYTVACVSSPGYTWDADTDMCYRIEISDKKNWADAERICTINKGHLIKPDTVTKNNKQRTLIQATGLTYSSQRCHQLTVSDSKPRKVGHILLRNNIWRSSRVNKKYNTCILYNHRTLELGTFLVICCLHSEAHFGLESEKILTLKSGSGLTRLPSRRHFEHLENPLGVVVASNSLDT